MLFLTNGTRSRHPATTINSHARTPTIAFVCRSPARLSGKVCVLCCALPSSNPLPTQTNRSPPLETNTNKQTGRQRRAFFFLVAAVCRSSRSSCAERQGARATLLSLPCSRALFCPSSSQPRLPCCCCTCACARAHTPNGCQTRNTRSLRSSSPPPRPASRLTRRRAAHTPSKNTTTHQQTNKETGSVAPSFSRRRLVVASLLVRQPIPSCAERQGARATLFL